MEKKSTQVMKKKVNESASNLWIYHHLTDIYNSAFFIIVFTEKSDSKKREIYRMKI